MPKQASAEKKYLQNIFIYCSTVTELDKGPAEDTPITKIGLRLCAVLPAVPSIPLAPGAAREQGALPTHLYLFSV